VQLSRRFLARPDRAFTAQDPPVPGDEVIRVMMDGLSAHLLTATQNAAIGCVPWVGTGDAEQADNAATVAMRESLAGAPARGRIVIGEGVKDDAPMLAAGELVGGGDAEISYELAVDPLEGTKACARGSAGAITVAAAAPPDTLLDTAGWYMDKLVVGARAAAAVKDKLDIDAPMAETVGLVANGLDIAPQDVRIVILDRPRNAERIAALREIGCKLTLITDGDVLGALRVLLGDADMLLGIGGAPEGVVTACAVQCIGGAMLGRLAPQKDEEHRLLAAAGENVDDVLSTVDLVRSDQCCMVATAVTDSAKLDAPHRTPDGWTTSSFVATPEHPGLFVRAVTGNPAVPPAPRLPAQSEKNIAREETPSCQTN
jgi:fructose-1,6-bisphosphatase II